MKKSEISPLPEYFDRYIEKTDDVTFLDALEKSYKELESLPMRKYRLLGDNVYETGKWTVKDILQHLIDTERIFCYRVTAFSRDEPNKMLSYDEDLYARNANANGRTLEELINELKIVRRSTIELYRSFTPGMLLKKGEGFKGEYSVVSIGFMIPGHQRWHLEVIERKYFPLLKDASS